MQKYPAFIFFLFLSTLIPCTAQWSYDTLADKKVGMNVAVIGDKIFFHSGLKKVGSTVYVTYTEVFDAETNQRQIYPLPVTSLGRTNGATATIGSKVIFAGGDYGDATNKVDIYDTTTGNWTTATLSLDRWYLAGAAINGKALFAGGFSTSISNESNVVNIYTSGTNTWTNSTYPTFGASRMTAIGLGNKIFLAGGESNNTYFNTVRIYDTDANLWSSATLSQRKSQLASVVYKNKIYFVGGKKYTSSPVTRLPSDTIDIYDETSGNWDVMTVPRLMHTTYTFQNPGQKRHYEQATVAGCKMFLVPAPNPRGGTGAPVGTPDTIAVYDFARNSWSYLALPHPRTQVTLAAAKNKVYFAGGADVNTMFWLNHIDIYTVSPILQSAVNNVVTTQHTFGTVTEGNQENISIQFSNQGDYDLFFHNPKISINGHVSDFTVDYTALPDTLEPTESFTIPVSFSPTTDGLREITISLYSNDPNNPVYTFTVNGTGHIPAPDLKTLVNATPLTSYDFGDVIINDQQSFLLQLSNLGDKELLFTSGAGKITISGDLTDFTFDYSAIPDLLSPAQTESFSVIFNPASEGTKQIILSIHSNDPDQTLYTFTVNGTAITPTNIHSEQDQQYFRVYPNPTNNNVIFETKSGKAWNAQLINSQGTLIQSGTFENGSLLDLSTLPSGLYFLNITGDKPSVVKILKK